MSARTVAELNLLYGAVGALSVLLVVSVVVGTRRKGGSSDALNLSDKPTIRPARKVQPREGIVAAGRAGTPGDLVRLAWGFASGRAPTCECTRTRIRVHARERSVTHVGE